jgi:molybdopterin synthase sulfur carrier subunit
MIRVLYFGVLRDALGRGQEDLEWQAGSTSDLLTLLRARGDDWAQALAPERVFRLVVNQQIVLGETAIADGAEVGILPPVTGG